MFIGIDMSVFVFRLWLEAIITTTEQENTQMVPSLSKLVCMDGFGYLDKKWP